MSCFTFAIFYGLLFQTFVKIFDASLCEYRKRWPFEMNMEPSSSLEPLDAVWQPVVGTRYRFYVYSAFVESRSARAPAVRVVAATKRRGADAVFCWLRLPGKQTFVQLQASVQAIRSSGRRMFSAAFVLCFLKGSGIEPQEAVGASVAIAARFAFYKPPSNLLLVLNTEPAFTTNENLYVCTKPFYFEYDFNEWLIEWIEMNRLLGVSHFYMYNHSVSERVGCLLNDYVKRGVITLLDFKLPILYAKHSRIEGKYAAYNDCLYRAMAHGGWLLVVDNNELVLPQNEDSLLDLLATLDSFYSIPSKAPIAYLFRHAYFYVQWPDDLEAPRPLISAQKTMRQKMTHLLKNRNKYAVRPREVIELGGSVIYEQMFGGISIGVPIEMAKLHHYQFYCKYENNSCLDIPSEVDRTAHRFSEELWWRVQAEEKRLKTFCPLLK